MLWWVNQEDVSNPNLEQESYWNPIDEVPNLPDLLSEENEEPSQHGNSEKTFLLVAEQKNRDANSLPAVFAQLEPESNDIKMTEIAISDLFQENVISDIEQADIKNKAEEHFNTMIDYMITVDVEGFAKLVNDIVPEGIEVTITDDMVNELGLNKEAGTYTLHGEDLFSNEFGLVLMQPEVISTLKDTITSNLEGIEGMIKIPSLLKESQKYVKTDMDFNQLLSLVSSLATDVEQVKLESVPVEGEADIDVGTEEHQLEAYQPEIDSFYQAGL